MWLTHPILYVSLLGNFLIGGSIHESLSARAGYARGKGSKGGERICTVLNWLDPRDGDSDQGDHCDIAIKNDIRREIARGLPRRR